MKRKSPVLFIAVPFMGRIMAAFTGFSLNKIPVAPTSAVGTTLPLHTYGMPNFSIFVFYKAFTPTE